MSATPRPITSPDASAAGRCTIRPGYVRKPRGESRARRLPARHRLPTGPARAPGSRSRIPVHVVGWAQTQRRPPSGSPFSRGSRQGAHLAGGTAGARSESLLVPLTGPRYRPRRAGLDASVVLRTPTAAGSSRWPRGRASGRRAGACDKGDRAALPSLDPTPRRPQLRSVDGTLGTVESPAVAGLVTCSIVGASAGRGGARGARGALGRR